MYVGGIAMTRGVSYFGTPPSPIFLDNLACDGEESSILACPRSMLGLHQCDHSQDTGVQCFGMWLQPFVTPYEVPIAMLAH